MILRQLIVAKTFFFCQFAALDSVLWLLVYICPIYYFILL